MRISLFEKIPSVLILKKDTPTGNTDLVSTEKKADLK